MLLSAENRRALLAGVCRDSLYQFVLRAWPVLEGAPLQNNWHIEAICEHLQAHLAPGGPQNFLINVPPGTGKSLLTSVFAPAWVWITKPHWRIVCASGTPSVVTRDSLKTRNLIKSAWYQETFQPDWKISSDQDEKQLFGTTKGGFRQGLGAGAAAVGIRAEWLLVDDPNDPKEVHSKAHQEAINERWWSGSFHNRIADPTESRRTLIMQRLHEMDLAGYVLEKEKGAWEQLTIRMEYETTDNGKKTFLGWSDPRTTEGELVFPQRFTRQWLEAEKIALGPSQSVGQLQQRPSNAAGNKFKREWWRFYSAMGGPAGSRPLGCSDLPSVALPQKFDRIIGSWDMAFKGKDDSDYVAGVVIAAIGANRFIREVYCEQVGLLGSLEAVRKQSAQWSPWQILIEDKANGSAVVEVLSANIPRLLAVEPRGGKESRAASIEPIIAAGNVYLPEGASWVPAFIEQFAAFPKGKNDDMVDATSQGLTHLEENDDVRRAKALLGMA